jgi:hypothetical protein
VRCRTRYLPEKDARSATLASAWRTLVEADGADTEDVGGGVLMVSIVVGAGFPTGSWG